MQYAFKTNTEMRAVSYCSHIEGHCWCLLILGRIEVLEVGSLEEFRQDVLSNRDQKHDHQREHNSGDRDPSQPEAHQQVSRLEHCEYHNRLERHGLDKCCVVLLKNPAEQNNIELSSSGNSVEIHLSSLQFLHRIEIVTCIFCSEL